MPAEENGPGVLPKDLMVLQLGQIDLLMAMYESDNAISIDASSSTLLETLRDWCENDGEMPKFTQLSINMLLTLEISEEGQTKSLQLHLSVPLVDQGEGTADEPPPVKTRIQQPDWMSKGEVAALTAEIPKEDILTVIEYVKDAAAQHLTAQAQTNHDALSTDKSTVRVWFYFPSISTRAKRDDLVNYSPTYGLTGFLLAGKPGILCLEGGSQAIDDFMKFIKTESWGDIPAHHKKVSERYREDGPDVKRAFVDMQEITDTVGEKRGERANRSDMRAIEAWLNEKGVGEAFAKVVM
ncbi:uncharacterized protein NECHADRAFT_35849 [Fusarium vanettenii 77-13-4]|uniref:Small nuclear ribonucleoprotein Prp3 C-terminal domain-containing protein n=1 Tax=Fusarium vanettenii (strain ATCC MYA-4622 / CBS 123669 / FGSC 9596 / NRRL 45880 / 77-13-4) TaxID=660122 RepID=C7YL13_FUSV7|nr:uncharacterized protein NECHADRAFT_35849 [Fusarium vanettenii 77-13-4]EEU46713.1 hypothetical protein NECHADRAFT_35849 [Fusarium vanettenii 77-13-4]